MFSADVFEVNPRRPIYRTVRLLHCVPQGRCFLRSRRNNPQCPVKHVGRDLIQFPGVLITT